MKKYKKLPFYCLIALLTAVIGSFWFNWNIKAPNPQNSQSKIFIIKKGEKTDAIIKKLYKEGLIKNPFVFKILLYKEGLTGKIQAGDFRLNSNMKALEIAKALTHGTLDRWLTIIEGWRAEEIAREINLNFNSPSNEVKSKFIRKIKKSEGFLFPDTYLIPKNASPEAVIQILRKNFDKKVYPLSADIKKNNLNLKQTIILASIVERESRDEKNRPVVAGILIKRWQNGWPLQADATIQYLLGTEKNWWPKIKKQDLKINSPYNTYLHPGLPPGPICNPSLSAIKAVIYSKKTDYWYYISDKKGKIHFARTLEEHNQNIKKYL